ncbi:lipopolysaccharide core heptose(I) kinase RfaP [Methylotenera sp.]|uniref:lipopolysaccharide core heptose(I) kinase RfaP n=1 Tax=Methylotenera sp. TaxID=2051956 RepID=UPI002EDAAAB8
MTRLELPAFISKFLGADAFAQVMQLQGRVYRNVTGRRTVQVQFGDESYFVKQHFGVGWKEIFKSFLSFKVPILGALTEVSAIQKLNEIGIETTPLVGYGVRGCNPATQQSFIITKDLGDIISLEDLCATWKGNPPDVRFKKRLIIAVAELARKLHKNGLNHRDFYLCHLCLDAQALQRNQIKLYLIDLHRMQIRAQPALKLVMKDIAGLYFSSMDVGLTARDYLRFKRHYAVDFDGVSLGFWQSVAARADKLYAKFHSDKFQKRLQQEHAEVD